MGIAVSLKMHSRKKNKPSLTLLHEPLFIQQLSKFQGNLKNANIHNQNYAMCRYTLLCLNCNQVI